MNDLIEFLRARLNERERQLDEDEQVALDATPPPWWHNPRKVWLDAQAFETYDRTKGEEFVGRGASPFSMCVAATGPANHPQSMSDAAHIAHWDPQRVLAEVEQGRADIAAKRAILTALNDRRTWRSDPQPEFIDLDLQARVIELLAQQYTGHPAWRAEWRP